MVAALAKFLAQAGCQVVLATPLYSGIRERFPALRQLDWRLDLPLGGAIYSGSICLLRPQDNLSVYFIDQPHFFARTGLYQEHGRDFGDNAERFIFFSKAVANLARHLPARLHVVHVHDWQAALVPLFLLDQRRREPWDQAPRCCLTIHNLAYQGQFAGHAYHLANLPPEYFSMEGLEFHGGMNCLKAGINFSQAITTVSPRYAREITHPELGFGLDGVLRNRQSILTGILNGVDYSEWHTRGNPNLAHPYDAHDLTGKSLQKAALQKELGLPVDPRIPLFGNIGRLVHQKGVDILLGALGELLAQVNLQFVSLGAGLPEFESALHDLARRYPNKMAVRTGYDHGLPHQIEAGCDFFLMPSKFEPCGLNQMYSLRYGAIPVVRATGGLDDSVLDIRESPLKANGIKFSEYSTAALAKAICKAIALYQQPGLLIHYRRNGMLQDFSWDRTAAQYLKVYNKILRAAESHPNI